MKKRNVILVLSAILVSLTISFSGALGQEIDVSNMDNEQLKALLLQILNKLEQEEEPEIEDGSMEVSSPAVSIPASETDNAGFVIYENKKLMIEALPDYMFIRKPAAGSEGSSDPELSFSTPEDCYIYCANLDWGDNEGYAKCVRETCGTDRPPNVSSEWRR